MTVVGFTVLTQLACLTASYAVDSKAVVVVRVNGKPITAADVDFAAIRQNLSEEKKSAAEPKLIETLIDWQLIRALLASKKIEPPADELQHRITRALESAEEEIRKTGEDPEKFLTKFGVTPARLKNELGLRLAWQVYAQRTITPEQFKEYFEQNKQELDGTQLRASQIFLKLDNQPDETKLVEKKEKLADLRRAILAGKLSFTDAAKQTSESPSAVNGGDVGLFGWGGAKLTQTVSQVAFALKVNDISEPIVSPFGVHLVQVTERHPGELSLEDVRAVVMDRLSQKLWASTVAKERETAKVVWEKRK